MSSVRMGIGIATLAAAASISAGAALAVDLVAVTNRNEIIYFPDATPQRAVRWVMSGTGGMLVGLDARPGNGMVYGLTSEGAILLINPSTGQATFQNILSVPLARAPGYLVDFNPAADRLRVVGAGGQNLRINVDTGATISDGAIRSAAGGAPPQVMAGAYSNSIRGATATQLYVFDSLSGRYSLQNPPNDGVLEPIGAIAVVDGADIHSDGTRNVGYYVANNMVHVFDPATGASRAVGMVGAGTKGLVIDIVVVRP